METNLSKYRIPLFIASGLFLLWGILGVMDFKNFAYVGYSTDNNFNIIEVEEGSPAEAAGMAVGDVIKSIDGIDAENTKAFNERARPSVGQTGTWLVDRGGEEMELTLTFASPPGKNMTLNYVVFVMGLIFLILSLWTYTTVKNKAAFYFTLFALFFGASFFGGPYFEATILRSLVNSVGVWLALLSFVFLVKFLLHYPEEKAFIQRKNANLILFGPAILMGLVFTGLNLFQPDSTQGLRSMINILAPVIILFYFVWAIILMVQNYNKASAETRKSKGLGMMVLGVVLGLLPIIISIVVQALSPSTILPGSDYAVLFFVLIPISFTLALRKGFAGSMAGA